MPGVAAAVIVLVLVFTAVPDVTARPGAPALLMLAVQLVCCLPWTRRLRGWWMPPAQAVLFVLGGPAAFLAATVLLVARGWLRWAAFALVVAATGVLYAGPDVYTTATAIGNAATQGLAIAALTRLSELRDGLRAARGELAAMSVARERERAGRDLEAVLGSALSRIIGLAAAGDADGTAAVARTAAARVRRPPAEVLTPLPRDLTPRLALPVVVAVYAWVPAVASVLVWRAEAPVWMRAAQQVGVVGIAVVQAYHTVPRPPDIRPRYAAWTVPAQMALCALPLLSPDRPYPQFLGWAAASILAVLRPRAAWPLAAVFAAAGAAVVAVRAGSAGAVASMLLDTVSTATLFYGLALLTNLVYEVRQARAAVATMAVARERRRISSDVHDLLGSGLSAIIVKADLAAGAPAEAAGQLADIGALARRALGELRAIPGADEPGLSLRTELDAGREVLAAAGVAAEVDAAPPGLPERADALLAVVLREAVTNVLRHSRARTCAVTVAYADGEAVLAVADDGAPVAPPGPPGQGVANLTERVRAAGGRLTAGRTDAGFALTVRIPARATG